MKLVAKEMSQALTELFSTKKNRLILLGLVLIAAMISVSELAVAKLFTEIILNEGAISETMLAVLVTFFFLFFGVTRGGQFLQRIYRVRFFDKAFQASKRKKSLVKENWRWSLAFELTNILSRFTQLAVVISFFTYLNWQFGIINLLIVLAVFQFYGRLFRQQIRAQRSFVVAKKSKNPVPNVVRIGTRIKSGEIGVLVSSIAMLILLALLMYLSYIGDISKVNTVFIFFGLRMQNSSFASISTSLMRFARARTHSE
jgi:hypothetical protein|uniref:hypothetical protein n=1 Tax=Candidatus Planktophila sp. TaxID=2175601 RepID=UPI00404908C0